MAAENRWLDWKPAPKESDEGPCPDSRLAEEIIAAGMGSLTNRLLAACHPQSRRATHQLHSPVNKERLALAERCADWLRQQIRKARP